MKIFKLNFKPIFLSTSPKEVKFSQEMEAGHHLQEISSLISNRQIIQKKTFVFVSNEQRGIYITLASISFAAFSFTAFNVFTSTFSQTIFYSIFVSSINLKVGISLFIFSSFDFIFQLPSLVARFFFTLNNIFFLHQSILYSFVNRN